MTGNIYNVHSLDGVKAFVVAAAVQRLHESPAVDSNIRKRAGGDPMTGIDDLCWPGWYQHFCGCTTLMLQESLGRGRQGRTFCS